MHRRTVGLREYCAACDVPFVEPNVIRFLFEKSTGSGGVIQVDGGKMFEPLCAVYRRESAVIASENFLKAKRMCMLKMFAHQKRLVKVPKEEISKIDRQFLTFCNINNDKDLAWAERIVRNDDLD